MKDAKRIRGDDDNDAAMMDGAFSRLSFSLRSSEPWARNTLCVICFAFQKGIISNMHFLVSHAARILLEGENSWAFVFRIQIAPSAASCPVLTLTPMMSVEEIPIWRMRDPQRDLLPLRAPTILMRTTAPDLRAQIPIQTGSHTKIIFNPFGFADCCFLLRSRSDSGDEMAELERELEKIKRERKEEQERKQREKEAVEAAQAERDAMMGNPLLAEQQGEEDGDFTIRRKWWEDTVFRNQAKGEPQYKKRFINDTLRNDFHKRFLNKYVK